MTTELDLSKSLNDAADLLELAAEDPLQAADVLDAWAAQLKEAAKQLRMEGKPPHSHGGFGDKVFAKVFGPDGRLKAVGES